MALGRNSRTATNMTASQPIEQGELTALHEQIGSALKLADELHLLTIAIQLGNAIIDLERFLRSASDQATHY